MLLRNLSGWLFCLAALLLGVPLLRLLAQPRSLQPSPDLVYVDQLFSLLIAGAGVSGLLLAYLLRLSGRTLAAIALLVPAIALCAWHLTHTHLGPVSPSSEQYQWLLAALLAFAVLLAGVDWLGRSRAGKALRYLGMALLLPWCAGLVYLARLYY